MSRVIISYPRARGRIVCINDDLNQELEIKTEILGPDKDEVNELKVLNRVIR